MLQGNNSPNKNNLQTAAKFGYGLKEEVLVYVMTEILFLDVLRTGVFTLRLSRA